MDRNCIRSGKCVEACPQDAITLGESGRLIDRKKCDRCLMCAQICPSGAIETVGRYMDKYEVMEEVSKDELFYRNSGGGVTVSGGEPLLQWLFVKELLKECKNRHFHTALDTSGCSPLNDMEEVLKYVDLLLYDVKMMDSNKHEEVTGVDNKIILSNVAKVAQKQRTWLRYPVIPGFNDSESCAREIAAFASDIPFEKVSLLPYHAFGAEKYERLGRVYSLEGVSTPTDEQLQEISSIFESFGLDVTIGY